MKRLADILSRLLLLVFSALLVLLPVELYLRKKVRLHPPISRADPVTGHSLRPNRTIRDTSPGDFSVTYTTNRFGFRYRDIAVEKPPGTLRILGVGDSFTFGVGVEQEQTFLAHLEDRLARTQLAPVEVVNCGASGWGTSNALTFLEGRGFAFNPDLILLGFFANDPEDDWRSDLYRVIDGTLERTPADELPAYYPEQAAIHSIPFYDFLARHSALLALLRTRYTAWRGPTQVPRKAARDPAGATGDPRIASDDELLAFTRLLFRRLRQVTAEHQIPVAVLLIPGRRLFSPRGGGEVRSRFSAVRRLCQDEQLPCLDTSSLLLGSGHAVDDLYYQFHDIHWTPLTHRLVSEALLAFLLDQGLLSQQGSSGTHRTDP